MKTLPIIAIVLVIGLALGLTGIADAQKPELESAIKTETASAPLALNLNIGNEPGTLDPAIGSESVSTTIIEQIFIGLVDLDDTTAEVIPELATSWTVSSDGTVYTFTLRDDATWTDGKPITAQDVRYGILRSLDPATASSYAFVLDVIKNARAYRTGAITDGNQVGVKALNATTLRITLEYPATHVLSTLSMWVARPMPQWTIKAHGVPTWTLPANIVTSGPYRLTEWAHNDHILLDKNPTYYDAENVQIEQVKMSMVDEATAWTMYQDGQLDTAAVPGDALLDPVLRQAVHIQPIACTYYYGFSTSQPPFDSLLVRKAFIAATNRQGLINPVTGGTQQPALTFIPPGVFGHVDGVAEGVGVPHNPTQARQWLSDAGYPNGAGLPPITLWFNASASHQAIAEYIRDSWHAALGVNVTLKSLEWQDYLNQASEGQFQIWRLSWCADYLDGYNFLHDAIAANYGNYGDWTNVTYDKLLDQAAREQNSDIRQNLMKQAEEILVDTDAVMLPIYYHASVTASQPYLERTYPATDKFDLATWRITRVSGTASPASGGSLTSYRGDTTIHIPAAAVTDTVIISQSPAYGMPPAGNLTGIGHVIDVSAVYSDTGEAAQPAPGQTYTVTVQYSDAEKGPAIEDTLALYWWDGDSWSQQGVTSSVNAADNVLTAQVDHFSLFAVLGETRRVHLPIMSKTY